MEAILLAPSEFVCSNEQDLMAKRGKEKAMCTIHMRVQCSDTPSKVLVDDVELTELTIEDIVSIALLEVFDTVLIENITVHHSPECTAEHGELV